MSILNTSVSGMQANSNWLSSISQNVANSNTTGYKNVETDFSSLVDQISNGDAGFRRRLHEPRLAATRCRATSSPRRRRPTSPSRAPDFSSYPTSSGTLYLTRNGSFTPDASGNLVNSAGYYLMAANVQNGVSPLAANSLTGLAEGQRRQRRPDRDGDDHRLAHRQSAVDRDAGRAGQSAVRQFGKLDLYRRDVACRLRQSRRLAHDQSLFRQHRVQHLGGRRVRRVDSVRQRRLSLFVGSARDADPDLQSDHRRAVLRLAALDSRSRTARR